MQISQSTKNLIRKIAVYGLSAILAAHAVAWWYAANSQERKYAIVAGLTAVAIYFAFLRFRFRLKTIVLITLVVAAVYGHRTNPVYRFVNERRASMAAADLGAQLTTCRYVSVAS